MKIKLNWLQVRKYNLIRKYLQTRIGEKNGLLLFINNSTNVYVLRMLYKTSSGYYIKGKAFPIGKFATDTLYYSTEITDIYKAGLKGDNSFRVFIKKEKGSK